MVGLSWLTLQIADAPSLLPTKHRRLTAELVCPALRIPLPCVSSVSHRSFSLFLFHVYRATLEPAHVTFEEFATEIGAGPGRLVQNGFASEAKET